MGPIPSNLHEPTQGDAESSGESNKSSGDDKPRSPQLELVFRNQKETRVSEGHVNTRFFIISDIHTDIFRPDQVPEGAAAAADVLICCGDLTDNSELHEYGKIIDMLSKVAAPLKLVVAGNHDGTLDSEGFWDASNWRYKRWPRRKSDKAVKLFGNVGEARLLLEREGYIVLDEGHHKFSLGNGAELRVYASPATPKRASRYSAFQYKKRKKEEHIFRINQDVDVVITHGPPRGILDPDPFGTKYRGCEDLLNSIARARPRLHCFGHNHGGWGAALVDWKYETDGEHHETKDLMIYHENELLSLKNINPMVYATNSSGKENGDRRRKELAKTRCVPTSHCAGDIFFVRKGKQTLFVNAAWSKVTKHDKGQYTQWPWLVDIEIPKQRDEMETANANRAEDGNNEKPIEQPSESCSLTAEGSVGLGQGLKNDEVHDANQVSTLQGTAGQHSNQETLPQGGIKASQEGKSRKGVYGFQSQIRDMKVNFWRQTTTEVQRDGADKAELDTSQGHGENSPPEKRKDNKKYGFSREDRDTSGPWRQVAGFKEGPGDGNDDLRPSSSSSFPDRNGVDQGGSQGPDGRDHRGISSIKT
ncbi:hypothetical protein VMCG_06526 [Cytospora schulzeri]|uniref:Calcineurin-like phosphoesterase domain-containing protein n=1 Tax=Cytospora schulzeri TaxID=448051 RepID=A0A423WBU6_9PEZI|nr:hypothetical protein VMCG_06526 [Valsa malicola]